MDKLSAFVALVTLLLMSAFAFGFEPISVQPAADIDEVELISAPEHGEAALIADTDRMCVSPGGAGTLDNPDSPAMVAYGAPSIMMPSGGTAAVGHYTRPV